MITVLALILELIREISTLFKICSDQETRSSPFALNREAVLKLSLNTHFWAFYPNHTSDRFIRIQFFRKSSEHLGHEFLIYKSTLILTICFSRRTRRGDLILCHIANEVSKRRFLGKTLLLNVYKWILR